MFIICAFFLLFAGKNLYTNEYVAIKLVSVVVGAMHGKALHLSNVIEIYLFVLVMSHIKLDQ